MQSNYLATNFDRKPLVFLSPRGYQRREQATKQPVNHVIQLPSNQFQKRTASAFFSLLFDNKEEGAPLKRDPISWLKNMKKRRPKKIKSTMVQNRTKWQEQPLHFPSSSGVSERMRECGKVRKRSEQGKASSAKQVNE